MSQATKTTSILRSLGIGLGLWQVLAPRRFARSIGVSSQRNTLTLIRLLGACELGMGLGLFSRARHSRGRWGRNISDVGFPTATREPIRRSVTIARPPAEVYRFWRDFQNLPKFMTYLESVEMLDGTRSYWRARRVGGKSYEWNAAIVEDRENELIRWSTLGRGSNVAHAGVVRFVNAPGGRGTEIHFEATYDGQGGPVARAIALAFGRGPGQQIESDLRRLKQVLETGEVIASDASIHRGMHPARPSVEPRIRRHGGQS